MLQTLFNNIDIFMNQFSNWIWYEATTQQILLILFASVIGYRFLIYLLKEFYAWKERMIREWQDRKALLQKNKNSLLQSVWK